jgi:hypothetical protein
MRRPVGRQAGGRKTNGRRVSPAAATISSSFVRTEFFASAAMRTKPISRSRVQPPFCELLEWVEPCEPSADFEFAPGQADAALLAKMNAIAAAILK